MGPLSLVSARIPSRAGARQAAKGRGGVAGGNAGHPSSSQLCRGPTGPPGSSKVSSLSLSISTRRGHWSWQWVLPPRGLSAASERPLRLLAPSTEKQFPGEFDKAAVFVSSGCCNKVP